jgi:hypothetical protein
VVTLEHKELDNATLYHGQVNRCVGSLQLSPISLEQAVVVLSGLALAIFVWMAFSIEIAITVFFIVSVTFIIWGGRDFGREWEKLKPTRTYYSETPLKRMATDGLPVAVFDGDDYVVAGQQSKQRKYGIERVFRHLRFYASYELDRADIGFYALNPGYGSLCYFIYGFSVTGFSPSMTHVDCMAAIRAINKTLKNLPGLKLKFIWEVPADGSAQILQQKRLLELAAQDELTVEIIKGRGQWAATTERQGNIVAPTLRVYARVRSLVGQENFIPQDWKDRWAARAAPYIERWRGDHTQQELLIQAMEFAYDACCRPVMRAFNEGMGIKARPLTVHELYCHDFAQLHDTPVERCPNYVRLTHQGLFEHQERINTPDGSQPLVPHHILGELFKQEGIPSVPVFYRNDVWFPLKDRFGACIRLTQMEGYADIDGSHALGHLQTTYRWLQGIADVQLVTEIEAVDPIAKKALMDKGITNRTKRSSRAIEKQTQDVDSMEDIDDLVEARRLFRAGEQTLSTATLVWIYRDSREQLQLAVQQVMGRIGSNNCELVQDSIEYRWIDIQPYAWETMCFKPINRRLEYMIPQALPLIPFTQPQSLDRQGIGYVGAGIPAQYFIDYVGEKNHTFIAAKSGGGKSLQALEIVAYCIATQTPGILLDSPPLADQSTEEVAPSTYTPAIELWRSKGVSCAYHDIKKRPFNILGRYGLGRNKWEIDTLVETHLDTLLAVVVGDNPTHPLKDDLINLLSLSYQDFLQHWGDNPEDPILSDYLRFYIDWSADYLAGEIDLYSLAGIENLGKFDPSDNERQAVGMIRSQILGVLSQPWGKRINAQTSFDPNVLFLVLGLTNVRAGSKEGLVYALAALAFMDRMASKYPRCVAGMDEGSTLLPMEDFAGKFARIFPEGRKKGVNGIFIATELDSLWNSPYCGQILDNFDNILVGHSEETSVRKFVDRLGFKEDLLRKYTRPPDLSTMSSQWYLKRGDQHLELLYYTLPILLSLGATSPKEIQVCKEFLSQYTDLLAGRKEFGLALSAAYAQGKPVTSILV